MQISFANVAVFNFYVHNSFVYREKKVAHTTSIYNSMMSNQMSDLLNLYMFSVFTFVIILFSVFYISPQLNLGSKYFNINQKYSHKMILTNN